MIRKAKVYLSSIGASKKTSTIASVAVILSAIFAFLGSEANSSAAACDLQRELRRESGSPAMRVSRESLIASYGAAAYFDLAQRTEDSQRRRELAYEAIIRVNSGILAASRNTEVKVDLWEFPSDMQINSANYFEQVWKRLPQTDYETLRGGLVTADRQIDEFESRQSVCGFDSLVGKILQIFALLLTVSSVILIVMRERHRDA